MVSTGTNVRDQGDDILNYYSGCDNDYINKTDQVTPLNLRKALIVNRFDIGQKKVSPARISEQSPNRKSRI